MSIHTKKVRTVDSLHAYLFFKCLFQLLTVYESSKSTVYHCIFRYLFIYHTNHIIIGILNTDIAGFPNTVQPLSTPSEYLQKMNERKIKLCPLSLSSLLHNAIAACWRLSYLDASSKQVYFLFPWLWGKCRGHPSSMNISHKAGTMCFTPDSILLGFLGSQFNLNFSSLIYQIIVIFNLLV